VTQPFSGIVFGMAKISRKASAGTGQRLYQSLEMDGEGNQLAHRPEKEPVRTGGEGFPGRLLRAAPQECNFGGGESMICACVPAGYSPRGLS
jgi:hypothetical protein